MAKELRIRRGTTAQHSAFTGAPNEVTADTTKKTLVLHDGVTAGGTPLATEASVTSLSSSITTGLAGKQDADAELTTLAGMSANRATFLASNQGFGFRNRIINGAMQIAQRASSVGSIAQSTAVPTASSGYRTVDRFFIYCTNGIIGTLVASSAGVNTLRIGPTMNTTVNGVGVGQRIEQRNSFDLAGSPATLSVNLSNPSSVIVTWTVSYANTADTFGTIGTPTKTQIATGTFATTPTTTRYTATMDIPLAATTGIEVLLTVSSLTGINDSIFVGDMQFESGSVATPFERRPFGTELALCQRYFQVLPVHYGTDTNTPSSRNNFAWVEKRAAPTTILNVQFWNGSSWNAPSSATVNAGTGGGYVSVGGTNVRYVGHGASQYQGVFETGSLTLHSEL